MRKPIPIRVAAALVATWLTSISVAAGAQDTPEQVDARYQELVGQGVDEFGRGNWGEAYVLLKQAYDLLPGPRPLWGMGKALFEQARYAETVEVLERALEENGGSERPMTPEQAQETQELLERARSFVAEVTVHVEPQGATLMLDGREVEGPRLILDGGSYRLVVMLEGYRPVEQPLKLEVGERREVTVELVPAAAGGGRPVDDAPRESAAAAVPWPLLLLSAGGVAAGAGAVVGALNASDFDDLEAKCRRGECSEADRAEISDGGTRQDMANALMFGGGALALAGAIWLVVDLAGGAPESSETAATVACTADGCGVHARGAF